MIQRCGRCKQQLSSDNFSPCHRGRDGFWCHECRRNKWPSVQYDAQVCIHCGDSYIPKQGNSTYCSRDCKDSAYKKRLKEELLAQKTGRTCGALNCDSSISHMRSDAKFCSNACSIRGRTPKQRRKYRLFSKYGISPADYDAMVAEQNSTCAICKGDDPKTTHGFWHIDHNHETGEVRGLLCSTCNTGLGNFYDNPEWLQNAADYLESSQVKKAV